MDTLKFVEAIKAEHSSRPQEVDFRGPERCTNDGRCVHCVAVKSSRSRVRSRPGSGTKDQGTNIVLDVSQWRWKELRGRSPDAIHLGRPLVEDGTPANLSSARVQMKDLPDRSIIVDVGGGLGHTTLNITKEYKHLKFIVQDRPAVIEQAKQACFIPQIASRISATSYMFPYSTGENRFLHNAAGCSERLRFLVPHDMPRLRKDEGNSDTVVFAASCFT
ncbi:S-adenosyl-L-methionine-dependent methyltransferase [Salix suchowensis]|nr:S-adenosyl-L-methionine-dependent methyltransferase [Salix suchowensis]